MPGNGHSATLGRVLVLAVVPDWLWKRQPSSSTILITSRIFITRSLLYRPHRQPAHQMPLDEQREDHQRNGRDHAGRRHFAIKRLRLSY